ncbi:MAG: CRISPR system precrRNA processing endoribonuclease RAMP protein Cas6 [bacterium]|nr:CRISPR system precrRNA processing endoribonuclease RAMP protein Cas6 [bacterium]
MTQTDLPNTDSATWSDLTTLPVFSCRVRLRFRTAGQLPPFKASTVRGALGHALKGLVCEQRGRPTCEGCPLEPACSYPWLFEGRSPRPNPWYQQSNASPPLRVQVPDEALGQVRPGDGLDFRLTVFGDGIAYTGLLLRAIDEVGQKFGLGRDHLRGAGHFHRLQVVDEDTGEPITDGYKLPERVQARPLRERLRRLEPTPWRRLLLTTPLQMKLGGRLWTDPGQIPPLKDWIESIQRRLYLLCWHLVPGFALAPPAAVPPAGRLLASDLRWQELNRYSHRDEQLKPLSGMTGWILYHVDGTALDELLAAAEWLGVGRQTVMGLGEVQILDR